MMPTPKRPRARSQARLVVVALELAGFCVGGGTINKRRLPRLILPYDVDGEPIRRTKTQEQAFLGDSAGYR